MADFLWPEKHINDNINEVQKQRQNYYNAARNFHYSYKVITDEHEYYVTEDFAELELPGKPIEYSVSFLLEEVNWYRLAASQQKSYYSLRLVSGLVLPLLSLLSILLVFRYKRKIGTLVFVLNLLMLANRIFLIL